LASSLGSVQRLASGSAAAARALNPPRGWSWADGSTFVFNASHWAYGEPNNDNGIEECMSNSIRSALDEPLQLNDAVCGNPRGYICAVCLPTTTASTFTTATPASTTKLTTTTAASATTTTTAAAAAADHRNDSRK
jgi:hypothetical protein